MSENGKPKPERARVLEHVTFALPDDETGKTLFPNLFDLLTPRWKDGAVTRQEGRLSLKPDGSSWRVSIECPTEGLQTSFVVHSLETLLCEAENHVSGKSCHWGLTWNLKKKNLPVLDSSIK
jgi:hypothetical protein